MRVLLLHNFMTPYRVPLFAELAQRLDLDVWILGDVRTIREWPGDVPQNAFRYCMLPHLNLPTGSRDYRILINYTLPRALRRHPCDAIICCGWDTPGAFYTAYHARRRDIPFVLWSGSTSREASWRRTFAKPLVRYLVGHANAWIAYGTRAKEYLVSMGADELRVFCAYNTVETEEIAGLCQRAFAQRDEFKRSLGLGTQRVILYCGQLIERKGLDDLLPAFASFARSRPDTALVIAGSGNREAHYRALAEVSGIGSHVLFAGFVPRNELPRYYAIADLFVLPSREEVWGLVVNEALACGVPVLTTDAVGASTDLMHDGVNGYVVPAAHPGGLQEALERHFSDATDAAAMARRARESILPFTIERAADAFVTAVQCAVGHT